MNVPISSKKKIITPLDARLETKMSLRREKINRLLTKNYHTSTTSKNEKQFLIRPVNLKITDTTLLRFRLKTDELQSSAIQTLFLLLSNKEEKYFKYGIYLVRKYFKEKITENNNLNEDEDIRPFLQINILTLFKNILIKYPKDYKVVFEIFWTLINITSNSSLKERNSLIIYNDLVSNDYIRIYLFYIDESKQTPPEILSIIFQLLYNISINDKQSRNKIKANLSQKTFELIKITSISNELSIELFRLVSLFVIDSDDMSIEEAKFYLSFFKSVINLNSSNENVTIICIIGISYLSYKQSDQFLYMFISLEVTSQLLSIIKDGEYKDDIILYIQKIFCNLILSQKKEIIEYLIENGIISYLSLIIGKIDDGYNKIEMKKEIIISIGNLCFYSNEIAIDISNNEKIFNFILESCSEIDFFIRSKAIATVFYIVESLNTQLYHKSNLIIQMVLRVFPKEINVDNLGNLINILVCLMEIENKIEKEHQYIKQYLIENGIEELISKKEIEENLPEFLEDFKKYFDIKY